MKSLKDLAIARFRTNSAPTEGQKKAGNYSKGIVRIHGLQIRIENPAGSTRSGTSPDGKAWSSNMHADYGYFMGTKAIDGDAIDCFIGPDLESNFVLVVDQYKKDGKFDESKVVIGTKNKADAEALYLKHYPSGWKLGPTATTTVQQIKGWLKDGNHKKPFVGQKITALSRAGKLIQFMRTWDGSKQRIEGGETVSPKLDGIYAKATKTGLFTSGGNPVKGQGLLKLRLKPHFLLHPNEPIEGELYRKGQSFQKTVSDFRQGKRLPFNVFPGQKHSPLPILGVKRVRSQVVKDSGEATTHYRQALKDGYEGQVILKDGKAFKRKPHSDSEYPIVSGQIGKKHGILTLRKGKKTFKVQAPVNIASNAPVGKKATVAYRRQTDGGIPFAPKFKHIRDYDMNSRLTSLLIQMDSRTRKPMNPALKAGIAGAVAGGAIGAIPGLKVGSKLLPTLKSVGAGAAGLGGLVGGGTYVGDKILGPVRHDEGAPFTKRAAIGGALLGTVAGAGAVIASKRFKPAAKFISKHAKDWRPARFIKNSSLPAATAAGAGVGAVIGADKAGDEGQQVDVINSLQRQKSQQNRRIGGAFPRSGFNSKTAMIKFQRLLTSEDGVPLNGRVAHDRFIKKIHEEDLNRRDANIGRASIAGAAAGALTPVKQLRGMPGTKALIGAGIGAAGVLGVRAITNRHRDIYGDRTRNAKRAELIPAVVGGGTAAGLGYRVIKKHFKLSSVQKMILFGRASENFRDTAIGAGALAAGGGVAYAGHRAGKALIEHEKLAKHARETAATVNHGVQKTADFFGRVRKFLGRKIFSANGRLIAFDIDAQNRETGQFTNAYKELLKRSVHGGSTSDISALKVAGAAKRISQRHTPHVMRAKRLARDLGLYTPKAGPKKEWEKPWVQKAAAGAVIAGGLLGHVAAVRKFPAYRQFVRNRVADGLRVKRSADNMMRDALGMGGDIGRHTPVTGQIKKVSQMPDYKVKTPSERVPKAKKPAAKTTGPTLVKRPGSPLSKTKKLSSLLGTIQFDWTADQTGWDLRDARGKSARVFAPGHQRRQRRPADWHETKHGQKKIIAGLGAAAAIGTGVIGYKLGGRAGMRKAEQAVAPLKKNHEILTKKIRSEAAKKAVITRKRKKGSPFEVLPKIEKPNTNSVA